MTYMKTLIELEIEEELYYLHSPRKKGKNRHVYCNHLSGHIYRQR